ncbi:hypothetical protein BJF78_15440 [Pseudonocardia sp. CNS-139]|nr:hypothetical protein BJF78_15440 [Pseudonocardia sp. CNS-139]
MAWRGCSSATLEETGLARLMLPAAAGGSEGTVADAAVVLVPLVETDLLAGRLLHAAGIAVPDGPLTVATGDVGSRLVRVPWARAARGVAVLAGDRVALLDPAAYTVTDGANVAEEPRDAVDVIGDALAVAPAPEGAAQELRLRGALAASVRHAGERVQFGRPIGRFQAVQQQLAPIAYQVHGAIGFTREHDLRLLTTRLWAWRDEDGSDAEWNAQLGATVLAVGAEELRPLVAGHP